MSAPNARLRTFTSLALLALTAAAALPAAAQQQPQQGREGRPAAATPTAPVGAYELLTPQNSTLLLVDHQPQMAFGVQSHDRALILNNTIGLAKAAKAFEVPTVLTTVAAESFSGPLWPEIQAVFPEQEPIDRASMNAWDDEAVRDAVAQAGRPKLVIAGLWTEVCVTMPTLEALRDGYEVYVVADASGGTSVEAHEMAVARMAQAGAIPVTWQQVMLEWQRDWARQETYAAVTDIVRQHSGAYGMGVNYAKTMFGSAGEGGGATKDQAAAAGGAGPEGGARAGVAFGQAVTVGGATGGD